MFFVLLTFFEKKINKIKPLVFLRRKKNSTDIGARVGYQKAGSALLFLYLSGENMKNFSSKRRNLQKLHVL